MVILRPTTVENVLKAMKSKLPTLKYNEMKTAHQQLLGGGLDLSLGGIIISPCLTTGNTN